ncbi:hypothetical protein ACMGD3_23865 [Lysinibacillus sphaericus]|uniref:hypothetical protein n=1 Tax=Lysinibacillus sphaericus TaxID=1421 RepID=UPI003F79FCB3
MDNNNKSFYKQAEALTQVIHTMPQQNIANLVELLKQSRKYESTLTNLENCKEKRD